MVDWFFQPSSVLPSQSSSRVSHVSVPGVPAAIEHCVAVPAPLHTKLPWRWQVPTPTVQDMPRLVNVSSAEPLQLSSIELHVSAVGDPAATEHCTPVPSVLQTLLP
jgi:hypothetical protein